MNWLYYLGEANLYLCIFYLCYCLFLNKETHYTLNRVYLLFSCVISFVLPLLQIGILKPAEHALTLNPVAVIPDNSFDATIAAQTPGNVVPVAEAAHFTLQDYILYAYLLGVAILLVLMAVKLYKLFLLSRAKHTVTADGYKLIYLNGSNTAFSFFNYLFIGTKAPGAATIIRHELVHIHQKHSVDIILLELFKIVNWFNPLIYLLQNSLKTVHEYIADEQTAAKDGDALTYSSFLVDNAYGISGSSITHSFFNYNLLKKRIIMLNQQRSGSLARLKYLITVPMCAALLCASTLGFSKTYGWVDLAPAHEVKSAANIMEGKSSTDTIFFPTPKPYLNKKGFLIDEKYYTVGSKKYFRTIISAPKGKKMPMPEWTDKNHNVILYLGEGNASGEEVVYGEFGYKFPNVQVSAFKTLPPPSPPMEGPTNGVMTPAIKSRNELALYADAHIKYPKAAITNEITGTVVAKFTLDEHHKIKDIKIINSVGYGCDEQVANMLKTYPGVIMDKYPDYVAAFTFDLFGRTKDYTIRKKADQKVLNAPNCILAMGLTEYGPDTKLTGSIPPRPTPPKPKVNPIKFLPPIVKPDNKPAPPKPKVTQQLKFLPPVIRPYDSSAVFDKFSRYLTKSIHYPAADRENNITGRVLASFTVDANNKVEEVKVFNGPSGTMNDEVARAIKSCNLVQGTKTGVVYTIPVRFTLSGYNGPDAPAMQAVTSDFKVGSPHVELSEVVVVGYVTQKD